MRSRKPLVALVAALLAAGPLEAQAPSPAPPAERTSDTWIEHYGRNIAQETAALRAAGLGADWDRIHPLVARHLQPQTYPQGPHFHRTLRAYHVASTANFLVRIGYRARHFAHPAQARTLVRAANIGSWDHADALVLVSPTVFVADFVRVERKPDNSADLVWRVSEAIKSSPPLHSEFRMVLHGPMPTVIQRPGQPPPPPPLPNLAVNDLANAKRILVFRPAPGAIGNFFGPMRVEGASVLPGYHATTRETTLAAVRAAARAQLCSPGYVPAARGIDLPHRC